MPEDGETMRIFVWCLVGAIAAPQAAQGADMASCAAALAPPAKLIFDDVVTLYKPGDSLHDLLHDHTRALVMAGKVTRADARPSAIAAAECLKLKPAG